MPCNFGPKSMIATIFQSTIIFAILSSIVLHRNDTGKTSRKLIRNESKGNNLNALPWENKEDWKITPNNQDDHSVMPYYLHGKTKYI